ncbi:MAG: DUF2752 domain-containing protein [Nocardioides sp.]
MTVAEATQRTRLQRLVAPSAAIGGLSLATVALHLRDPHAEGSWGFCPSALLGFWCPGCGGLRAVHDLTDLRLADAASSNVALIVAMPVLVLLLAAWWVQRWRGPGPVLPPRVVTLGLGLALAALAVFTLLRNLPWFGWLAP